MLETSGFWGFRVSRSEVMEVTRGRFGTEDVEVVEEKEEGGFAAFRNSRAIGTSKLYSSKLNFTLFYRKLKKNIFFKENS